MTPPPASVPKGRGLFACGEDAGGGVTPQMPQMKTTDNTDTSKREASGEYREQSTEKRQSKIPNQSVLCYLLSVLRSLTYVTSEQRLYLCHLFTLSV